MTVYHSLTLHLEREQLRASVTPITEGSLALRIEESDLYSGIVLFIDNTPENIATLEQICTSSPPSSPDRSRSRSPFPMPMTKHYNPHTGLIEPDTEQEAAPMTQPRTRLSTMKREFIQSLIDQIRESHVLSAYEAVMLLKAITDTLNVKTSTRSTRKDRPNV